MSTQYQTEPPATATVLLHTTAGPLTISVFAQQTPLTSRNFMQHCLDGYYDNCTFHRVSPGFVIQTGDPTGTGEGGQNIYDLERDLERYDAPWAKVLGNDVGEKIRFGDEIHGRLHFNRRGLVGMAKMDQKEGGYGSQFFITLADCRRELDGKCTMFGRIEGEGIYNVVKIAEGELVEGAERPVYPETILRTEVLEFPKGEAWGSMSKRKRTAISEKTEDQDERPKKIAKKKKGGKVLLSFGGDEGEAEIATVKPPKKKFNPMLIDDGENTEAPSKANGSAKVSDRFSSTARRKAHSPESQSGTHAAAQQTSPTTSRLPEPSHRHTPSFHDSTTQLPLRDPEIPSRSRSQSPHLHPYAPRPEAQTATSLNAEIAALKASMRRDVNGASTTTKPHKLSALEQMIPVTSTRGRKRPRPGDNSSKNDTNALKMLNAFKARLDGAQGATDPVPSKDMTRETNGTPRHDPDATAGPRTTANDDDAEEAPLCDLHFIANCQSCSRWEDAALARAEGIGHEDHGEKGAEVREEEGEEEGSGWMSHALRFEKDRLGKDLNFRKKAEEELVVIDPRAREREIGVGTGRAKGKGKGKNGGGRDGRG